MRCIGCVSVSDPRGGVGWGSRPDAASDAVHALHAAPAAPAVHAMHAFRRHTAKGIIASDCKGTPLNSHWGTNDMAYLILARAVSYMDLADTEECSPSRGGHIGGDRISLRPLPNHGWVHDKLIICLNTQCFLKT